MAPASRSSIGLLASPGTAIDGEIMSNMLLRAVSAAAPPASMTDHPNSIVIKLVMDGEFEAASTIARERGMAVHEELARIAGFLSLARWLAVNAEAPLIRTEAQSVLATIGTICRRWVENAQPRPPPSQPGTKAEFDRLIVDAISDRGFYHPIRVPGIDGQIAANRSNAPDPSGAYHAAEWELLRPLLTRACGGTLRDKVVVDIGCADGFFALNLAREGARVIAIDIAVTMAQRTATLAALNGLQDRIVVQLGPAHELAVILERVRAVRPDLAGVDAICALGVVYHFNDLVGSLHALTRLRVPILFEFNATLAQDESGFDPSRHRNPMPVSLVWLRGWLRAAGFACVMEPAWRTSADRLAKRPIATRQEMLLAMPSRG
ncbi:MAG: class I SAM-dependent methyltransferase [Thalassobaculaceae bacterium]|nr:class I SAM-dependent methyltransferase [Thalassobaculaceae bacterium]